MDKEKDMEEKCGPQAYFFPINHIRKFTRMHFKSLPYSFIFFLQVKVHLKHHHNWPPIGRNGPKSLVSLLPQWKLNVYLLSKFEVSVLRSFIFCIMIQLVKISAY